MASTILEFAQEKKNIYVALQEKDQAALARTTQELTGAQNRYDTLVGEFADLEKEVKEKRKETAGALMPADIEALAGELRDLIIQLRKKRVELLASGGEIASLKNYLAQAEVQLNRSTSQVGASDKELKAALDRATNHTQWKEALTDGSLSELADNAEAVLAEIGEDGDGGDPEPEDPLAGEKELIKAAKARIDGDIPENLMIRALEKGTQVMLETSAVSDLLAAVEDEEGQLWEAKEGDSGKVAKLWVEFLKAEDAFKYFVLLSASNFQTAIALLKAVTDSTQLTDAEHDRVNDANLVNDGEDAIPLEKARDDAMAAARAKEIELELAIAQAYVEDIDADPEEFSAVQTIRTDLESLNTALSAAEGAYTNDMRDDLDRWEASIPDHIWTNLVAYDQAIRLLTAIKDGDPAALATSTDNAETDLADALTEQDEGLRTFDALDDIIDLLYERLDFENAAQQQRILSAVRGDN